LRCQGAGLFADGNFLYIYREFTFGIRIGYPYPNSLNSSNPKIFEKRVPTKRAKKEFVEKKANSSAAPGHPGTSLALNTLR
jgi:hypothetical protein